MDNVVSFIIWGSAGHAKVLASLINLKNAKILALFDNCFVPSVLSGIPIYIGEAGFTQWKSEFGDVSHVAGLVAIGGNRGSDRTAILKFLSNQGLLIPNIVHPSASVCESVKIGDGTQVLAQAVVSAGSSIGSACIINNHASVDHECILDSGVHIAPGAVLCGCVKVKKNVFVGAGAVVLPHISIGEDAIVGAGAVVTRNVAPGTIVVGNPAKPFIQN